MATAVTRNILYMPGRLYSDPTDLSIAAPYGGTALGVTRNMQFRFNAEYKPATAEEWGNSVVEIFYGGMSPVLGATLREFDAAALAAVFLDTEVGDPSGKTSINIRADSNRAGTRISTKSMKLLFVPRASVRQPAILLRDALPIVGDDAAIALAMNEEVGINVLWYARPDTNEDVAVIGRLGDITL